ncbi:hypothetical protein [Pseudoxanthomonas mexicana]
MESEFFGSPPFISQNVLEKCISFLESAGQLNLIVRSSKLQGAKIKEIDKFIAELKAFKRWAIDHEVERLANDLFHFQCFIRSIQSSLETWLNIKNNEPESAWHSLMDAIDYKDIALRIQDYEGIRKHEALLIGAKRLLFPEKMIFNSPAFRSTIGTCSICGAPFQSCDHIEDFIYSGRLCRRINISILEANHSAIVENPRDPRCIMTERSDEDGNMINMLSLELTGEKLGKTDNAMHVKGIILATKALDVE